MDQQYKIVLLYIIQIVSIYNAILLGWSVKKIGLKTYKLSKKINDQNSFDIKNIVNEIISFNIKES
jgi:hypothetical protein